MGKLIEAVGNLPGGNFNLRLIKDGKASRRFDFLRHRLQLVNGVVCTLPKPANFHDLSIRLSDLDERAGKLVYPGRDHEPLE